MVPILLVILILVLLFRPNVSSYLSGFNLSNMTARGAHEGTEFDMVP